MQHITEDSRDGEWLYWVYSEHPEHFDAVLSTAGLFANMQGCRAFGPDKIDLHDKIRELSGGRNFAPDGALPFPEALSQTAERAGVSCRGWLCAALREALEREVQDVRLLTSVLDSHGDQIPVPIEIEIDAL
jgi:hypothetical protein